MKELLERDDDFLRAALEAEMIEAIGAAKGERSAMRLAYRSGYYGRSLITRVGILELRVPQDRAGCFFDQAVRTLSALGKGVGRDHGRDVRSGRADPKGEGGDRGVGGHSLSASAISAANKSLDEALGRFAEWRLDEAFPYLIIDARHEKVR